MRPGGWTPRTNTTRTPGPFASNNPFHYSTPNPTDRKTAHAQIQAMLAELKTKEKNVALDLLESEGF